MYVCVCERFINKKCMYSIRGSPVTINVESVIIRVDVQKIISNLRYEVMTSFIIKKHFVQYYSPNYSSMNEVCRPIEFDIIIDF